MVMTGMIEWHDLKLHPDDLPGDGDPIFVTVEMPLDGTKAVWMDVFLKDLDDGDDYMFCHTVVNEFGQREDVAVWYPVIAWAYPPEPYVY